MSDLTILLERFKQDTAASKTGHLEDAATLLLLVLVAVIALAGWL